MNAADNAASELPESTPVFEITTLGKAALAWDDAKAPTLELRSVERGDKSTSVRVIYGAEPQLPGEDDDEEREPQDDGVEVALTSVEDDEEPDAILIGLAWAHNARVTSTVGTLTCGQLDQLIDALTLVRDESAKAGILRPPSSPDISPNTDGAR